MNVIDEYIAQFEPDIQQRLRTVRETIHRTAPLATEKISYAMPTFYQHGNMIHFAAAKNHIGLYPGPDAIVAFADKLNGFETSKGAIRMPFSQPLPLELIEEITRYCIDRNVALEKEKRMQKQAKTKGGVE